MGKLPLEVCVGELGPQNAGRFPLEHPKTVAFLLVFLGEKSAWTKWTHPILSVAVVVCRSNDDILGLPRNRKMDTGRKRPCRLTRLALGVAGGKGCRASRNSLGSGLVWILGGRVLPCLVSFVSVASQSQGGFKVNQQHATPIFVWGGGLPHRCPAGRALFREAGWRGEAERRIKQLAASGERVERDRRARPRLANGRSERVNWALQCVP